MTAAGGDGMETRRLGTQGLVVGAIGLGCMSMSDDYGRPEDRDEAEAIATIHRALERGVTLLDTAEAYGPYTNEELLGKALQGRRSQAVIATKFGLAGGVDGSPANAKRVAEASLQRLRTEVIDVYYLHRKDPAVPIEETVGAMKELVEAGKVRYLGLSEVGPETLRRAHRIHPISVLQSEYSLWERGIEQDILPGPAGAGHRLGALQPPGPRLPDRRLPELQGPSGGRLAEQHTSLRRGERRRQRQDRRGGQGGGRPAPGNSRPGRPGLGADPGPGHRAHSRARSGGSIWIRIWMRRGWS